MNETRNYIREQLNDNAKMIGLFFGLIVFVFFISGFFSNHRLGTMDTGKYQWVMKDVGLSYTQEALQEIETLTYNRVIEDYDYGSFSYAKLLAPSGNTSMIYPIALIRLLTKPFGLNFSVRYLYLLYALLVAYGVYMLVRSCAYLAGKWAVIPGGCLLLLLSNVNLTAYFSSLYVTGTVIVSLLLMTGAALRLFSYGETLGFSALVRFLLSAAFCLNASELSFVFIPFAVALTGFALWKGRKVYRQKKGLIVGVAIFLMISIYSSLCYSSRSVELHSDAAQYHSAFLGFLQNTKDATKDLAEFGLDESYSEDIGKSYYHEETDYAHNPRDPKEAAVLFEKLNERTIAVWYWRHPNRILKTVMGQKEAFNHFETQRTMLVTSSANDPQSIKRGWSNADTLFKMFLPSDYRVMNFVFCLVSVAMLLILYLSVKKREVWYFGCALCAWLWVGGGFALALVHVCFLGSDSLELVRVISVFFLVLSLSLIVMIGGAFAAYLSVWFRKTQETCHDENSWAEWQMPKEGHGKLGTYAAMCTEKLRYTVLMIASSRRYTIIVVFLLALFMSGIIQFTGTRAGCVNNGDFGRMMEQLGLIWQGDIFYDIQAQLSRSVIEQYAYRGDFDWTALTALNPKYSLIYPATIIRGLCSILQQPFSTWYLSILMNFILILCITSIVKDLYAVFDRWTLPFGVGMCFIFLCESYIVWFNLNYS